LFAGVIVVLTLFDGKLQPEFSLGVTLNVLIEFITSIAKLSFMISIVSSLGQLKWLWFKADAQPLTDFQLHEDATGGGLGSLRLLFSLKVLVKLLVAILYYLPDGMLNTLQADRLPSYYRCHQRFLYVSSYSTSHFVRAISPACAQWQCFNC
jgi:hypothetical protein